MDYRDDGALFATGGKDLYLSTKIIELELQTGKYVRLEFIIFLFHNYFIDRMILDN